MCFFHLLLLMRHLSNAWQLLCCRFFFMVPPDMMEERFYNNRKWLMIRQSVLRRDGYICQLSKRYGKMKQANTVHHIFPRDEFPQYQYELWNLISLSAEKHNELHDRNTNALTEQGIDLLRRTARRQGIDVPLRYR